MKKAFVTGITGMDGSYLAEHLLGLGYEVHGMIRRSSNVNSTDRLDSIYQDPHLRNRKLFLHYGDMCDSSRIMFLIAEIRPDEIYNLAAMSHVAISFLEPEYAIDVDGTGLVRILEAVRAAKLQCKIYQASTSELFGNAPPPQGLGTPFSPESPYAIAKHVAFLSAQLYRKAYGMFVVNGILFNHTSPRRGHNFVEQKIATAAAAIACGKQSCLFLGNLDSGRDLGHAKDYVRAMHLMLQQDKPGEWIVATGRSVTVRELVNMAFRCVDIDISWSGSGLDEIGSSSDGRVLVRVDPKYFRPRDVEFLQGDSSATRAKLNWEPTLGVEEIVREMVASATKKFGLTSNDRPGN